MSLSATSKWGYYNYVNFKWVTTQFATAMGIGILFVPQEIGPKAIGLFPFITLAIICIPLAYLNHKTLSNLIISGGNGGGSVQTIQSISGKKASYAYSLLLFISSITICIINFVALISAVSQSISPQYSELARPVFSLVLGALLYLLSAHGHARILLITKYISVPLAIVLFSLSLLLIPKWDVSVLSSHSEIKIKDMISYIPVIIFAMNFSPCVSKFVESVLDSSSNDGEEAKKSSSATIFTSCSIIAITVMFFSFSVSMSLTDSMLVNTPKNTNAITLVSQFSNSNAVNIAGLAVVVIASFGALIGTIIGVKDGLNQFYVSNEKTDKKMMLVVCFGLALFGIVNPNVMDLIKTISGPSVIIIGMLFPAIVMLKNKKVNVTNFFAIVVSGIVLSSGYIN